MGRVQESITEALHSFIEAQHLFFVATAPAGLSGHINVSPKGLDCFRVLSERQVGYLDMTGSGNETSAHLLENGRVTILFCAFTGSPQILRLYGTGRVILPVDEAWGELRPQFGYPGAAGVRQIVVVDVKRVQTSCGFAVPRFDFVDHRDALLEWSEKRGALGIADYHREKNVRSIDGLPTPIGQALTE